MQFVYAFIKVSATIILYFCCFQELVVAIFDISPNCYMVLQWYIIMIWLPENRSSLEWQLCNKPISFSAKWFPDIHAIISVIIFDIWIYLTFLKTAYMHELDESEAHHCMFWNEMLDFLHLTSHLFSFSLKQIFCQNDLWYRRLLYKQCKTKRVLKVRTREKCSSFSLQHDKVCCEHVFQHTFRCFCLH